MGEETTATAGVRDDAELGAEAVELLSELIRIDTSNPPGNEQPAQELLAETLSQAGFECELLAAEPGRPNLVARLRGNASGATLCLLGHADTVPADPAEWSFDPWSGDVVNGEVRGRGAQDMKDQVATEVAAAAALGRAGWRPERGELLVVTTADEEAGAAIGAQWLCREHPEKVRSDYVLNEGGGVAFELDGKRFYSLCVGEKGVFRFNLRARGVAGHASVPGMGDNALLKLAPLIERLRHQPRPEPTEAGLALVAALSGDNLDGDGLADAVERLRKRAPELVTYLVDPMLRVTLVPTKASASRKENVIPSHAEVLVDCRVPPGMGEDDVRERVSTVLGRTSDPATADAKAEQKVAADPAAADAKAEQAAGYELEFVEHVVGNSSRPDSDLSREIEAWLADADPGAVLVPIVMPGFSDSHWFRKAFDSAVVYGFCPQRELSLLEAAPLVHNADERAAVGDIELAARFYRDIVQRVLG